MQPHPLANFIWAKLIRFGQIWLDLSKIKILHLQKHSISYGYVFSTYSNFHFLG